MRAVPDVYPPPAVMTAGGGLAKEVYPRDPNNALLWGGAVPMTAPTPNGSQMVESTSLEQSDTVIKDEPMRGMDG
jgi:hypothetical protein